MSDVDMRGAERARDKLRLLVFRYRTGKVTHEEIRLAAILGHPEASQLIYDEWSVDNFLDSLGRLDPNPNLCWHDGRPIGTTTFFVLYAFYALARYNHSLTCACSTGPCRPSCRGLYLLYMIRDWFRDQDEHSFRAIERVTQAAYRPWGVAIARAAEALIFMHGLREGDRPRAMLRANLQIQLTDAETVAKQAGKEFSGQKVIARALLPVLGFGS